LSSTTPTYVIDASVAIKWFLEDEDYVEQAQAVFTAYNTDAIRLIAPEHLILEVANAIFSAVRSNRVTAQAGDQAMSYMLALDIPRVGGRELVLAGYRMALRFQCTFYDALYLALADAVRCPLLHADRRLQVSVAGRFPLAYWVGRFPV
jgi:predicted nucleic acid-binding protein